MIDVMEIGKRICAAREDMGISKKELAERINVSAATITRYEKGQFAEPKIPVLVAIAKTLGVNPAWICLRSDKKYDDTPAATHKKGVKIPVLGYVAAGIPFEAIENVIDEEEIDEVLASKGDFFGLVIHGESMEPEICDGDTVIVRKQETCESRQIAIVLINGYDATCKIVHRQPDGILLEGINRDVYTPTFYSNEAIKKLPVQIVGIVAEVRRKYPI